MLQTDAAPPDLAVLQQSIADRVGSGRGRVRGLEGPGRARVRQPPAGQRRPRRRRVPAAAACRCRSSTSSTRCSAGAAAAATPVRRSSGDAGSCTIRTRCERARRCGASPATARRSSTRRPRPIAAATELVRAIAAARRAAPSWCRGATAQVVDYQSADARRAVPRPGRAAVVVDDEAHDWALTRAVIESWFKVLTYKDEYEVARLHLKVDYDRVADELGIDGRLLGDLPPAPALPAAAGQERSCPMGKPYDVGVPGAAPDEASAGHAVRPVRLGTATVAPSAPSIEEFEALITRRDRAGLGRALRRAGPPRRVRHVDQGLRTDQGGRRSRAGGREVAELVGAGSARVGTPPAARDQADPVRRLGPAGTDAEAIDRCGGIRHRVRPGTTPPRRPTSRDRHVHRAARRGRATTVHDGVGLEWFDDDEHLASLRRLARPGDGGVAARRAAARPCDEPVVVVEEHVVRGADWLEDRRREGAVVVRPPRPAPGGRTGSRSAQFLETVGSRRPGRSGGTATRRATVIPDEVRGLAYVQNHPRATGRGRLGVRRDQRGLLRRPSPVSAPASTGSASTSGPTRARPVLRQLVHQTHDEVLLAAA